jgi:hypothetical protein
MKNRAEAKKAVERDNPDARGKEKKSLIERALWAGWKALDDVAKAKWAADAPELVMKQLSGKQFYLKETRAEAKAAVQRDHADASGEEKKSLLEKALRAGWKALDDVAKAQWAADAPEVEVEKEKAEVAKGKQIYFKEKRSEMKAVVERDNPDARGKKKKRSLIERALCAGWKALDDVAKAQWIPTESVQI